MRPGTSYNRCSTSYNAYANSAPSADGDAERALGRASCVRAMVRNRIYATERPREFARREFARRIRSQSERGHLEHLEHLEAATNNRNKEVGFLVALVTNN